MELLTTVQKAWVTRDGYIRQVLHPNGSYEESRSQKDLVHKGRYSLKGNRIYYNDDTGFVSTGSIEAGILYQNGHTFYPEDCVRKIKENTCYL